MSAELTPLLVKARREQGPHTKAIHFASLVSRVCRSWVVGMCYNLFIVMVALATKRSCRCSPRTRVCLPGTRRVILGCDVSPLVVVALQYDSPF